MRRGVCIALSISETVGTFVSDNRPGIDYHLRSSRVRLQFNTV